MSARRPVTLRRGWDGTVIGVVTLDVGEIKAPHWRPWMIGSVTLRGGRWCPLHTLPSGELAIFVDPSEEAAALRGVL